MSEKLVKVRYVGRKVPGMCERTDRQQFDTVTKWYSPEGVVYIIMTFACSVNQLI